MWHKLIQNLSRFPSAVLTAPGADGYPVSVRCAPRPDPVAHVLRLQLPPGAPLQPGPASILGHSHDRLLWNLRNFLARGRLEQDEQGWLFRPTQFTHGAGFANPLEGLKTFFKARETAKRYLEKRGLRRPAIPWEQVKAVRAEAKEKAAPRVAASPKG
jgi:hypothetical protein